MPVLLENICSKSAWNSFH